MQGSYYQVIKDEVPAETFVEIQNEMTEQGLLGLRRDVAPTRRYPNGTLASNLIGWVNKEGMPPAASRCRSTRC